MAVVARLRLSGLAGLACSRQASTGCMRPGDEVEASDEQCRRYSEHDRNGSVGQTRIAAVTPPSSRRNSLRTSAMRMVQTKRCSEDTIAGSRVLISPIPTTAATISRIHNHSIAMLTRRVIRLTSLIAADGWVRQPVAIAHRCLAHVLELEAAVTLALHLTV